MAGTWRRLQSTRRIVRWPIKWGIFAVVFLLTLYPHPNFLRRHIQHLRGLDRLPDSAEPALAPLAARFRSYLEDQGVSPSDGPALLAAVNRFVHREVPYAWDWEVWGVADYLPTVAEVVARGREDCDGRAVVAAALLRGENIPAELVADTRHMWVRTPQGETMNPLGAPIVTSQAGRTRVAWSRLLDVGPPSFGMSVFPLKRELIILATAWVLLLPPRIRWRTAAIGLLLLVQALLIIRMAGADPIHPRIGGIVLGLLNLLAAVVILVWRSPRPQAARENVPTSLFVMKELG